MWELACTHGPECNHSPGWELKWLETYMLQGLTIQYLKVLQVSKQKAKGLAGD